MDAGAEMNPFLADPLDHLNEHREEMALWLALEVLQLNPVALEDEVLVDRLIACQDRVQERLRAKVAQAAGAHRAEA
jgi:hypothetical protein